MRIIKAAIFVMALIMMLPSLSSASEDGSVLYKAKCAMCHGTDGGGKIGPSLKDTKLTDAQIADLLSKGQAGKKAPHTRPMAGLSGDQARSVAEYVKSLK